MPRLLLLLAVLLLCSPAHAGEGIEWEPELDAGLLRAAHEGRPVLICVNALADESANIRLATQLYPSERWGRSTRGYVSFIASPNRDGTAKEVLAFVMRRFGNDLISPQHFIFDPDGDLAYRKPYYEGVVGPALFEDRLARISPPVAYSRAAIDREAEIEKIVGAPLETLDAEAKAWLAKGDGFAVVGLLAALDDAFDAGRRLTLIQALADAPPSQGAAVAFGADERTSYPNDEPDETAAWLRTLFAVDRERAIAAAARAVARAEEPGLRKKLLSIWAPRSSELPRAAEALLLAGDPEGRKLARGLEDDPRVARALAVADGKPHAAHPLSEAIRYPAPGPLYLALVSAASEDVKTHRAFVVEQLRESPHERVRVAAAIALLQAGGDDVRSEVSRLLAAAVFDPVEGPDTRLEVARRLGADPGARPEAWATAIEEHLK